MALFKRRARSAAPSGEAVSDAAAVRRHFESFASSRRGVEAYVEPPTNITATTVVLVAHDGEWTRRAIGSRNDAFALTTSLGLPTYDVAKTGYPSRMRTWTSRKRRGEA